MRGTRTRPEHLRCDICVSQQQDLLILTEIGAEIER